MIQWIRQLFCWHDWRQCYMLDASLPDSFIYECRECKKEISEIEYAEKVLKVSFAEYYKENRNN